MKFFETLSIIWVLCVAAMILSWPVNAYQFTQCDFDTPIRCEALHGAGVFVPVLAPFVVFADTDE